MNKYVKHLPLNENGRDFVVGDLHGCKDQLFQALDHLKFDQSRDRVISVGDLVDRGPKSFETAELIYQPWFHCVRGNHEDMFIRAHLPTAQYDDSHLYNRHYGAWTYQHSQDRLNALAIDLDALPFVIVVGKGTTNRYNVVHAELIQQGKGVSDHDVDNWTFDEEILHSALWGRMLIGYESLRPPFSGGSYVADQTGLSTTFVGHTTLISLARIQNQVYLDRGCVFDVNKSSKHNLTLAIAIVQEQRVIEWHPSTKQVVNETKISEIKKEA